VGTGNLGTNDGNWEQPTNFAGSQLLRQVFGAASFWWGLLYRYKWKGLFCCSQKVASGIKEMAEAVPLSYWKATVKQ